MERILVLTALAASITGSTGCDLLDFSLPGFDELPLDGLTDACPAALESGDPSDCNGEYTGTITIEALTTTNIPLASCSGEATMSVEASSETALVGEASCVFDGLLASMGEQEGWFEGQLTDEDELQGEIELGDDITAWGVGGYDVDGGIIVGFEGSWIYEDVEVIYQGLIELE